MNIKEIKDDLEQSVNEYASHPFKGKSGAEQYPFSSLWVSDTTGMPHNEVCKRVRKFVSKENRTEVRDEYENGSFRGEQSRAVYMMNVDGLLELSIHFQDKALVLKIQEDLMNIASASEEYTRKYLGED